MGISEAYNRIWRDSFSFWYLIIVMLVSYDLADQQKAAYGR